MMYIITANIAVEFTSQRPQGVLPGLQRQADGAGDFVHEICEPEQGGARPAERKMCG